MTPEDRSGLPDWIVVCSDDDGQYELATRTVFESYEVASWYAATIDAGRAPIVVRARSLRLRFDDERGTAAYWNRLGARL